MPIKSPNDYQASYVKREKNRVDFVACGTDYAPNREQALEFEHLYFTGTVSIDALALVEALAARPKATTVFVNATCSQLGEVWQYLCDNSGLDVRYGTLGYNASGLTVYK